MQRDILFFYKDENKHPLSKIEAETAYLNALLSRLETPAKFARVHQVTGRFKLSRNTEKIFAVARKRRPNAFEFLINLN